MTLSQLRGRIDALDRQILRLLNRRAQLALSIGRLKRRRGLPVFDSRREAMLLRRLQQTPPGPLTPASIGRIFRQILRHSRRLQSAVKPGRRSR